jgi:hypothetical protein
VLNAEVDQTAAEDRREQDEFAALGFENGHGISTR